MLHPSRQTADTTRYYEWGKRWELAVSRVLSWAIIHLGSVSPQTSSGLPGGDAGRTMPPYLALLRVGFTVPRCVATRAVRSYRTLSPLPVPEGHRRSALCCTFRRLTPPRRYLAPCPLEPGLSSADTRSAAIAWPTPARSMTLFAAFVAENFAVPLVLFATENTTRHRCRLARRQLRCKRCEQCLSTH